MGAGEGVDVADNVVSTVIDNIREVACEVLHKEHDWVLDIEKVSFRRAQEICEMPIPRCLRCGKVPSAGKIYLRVQSGGKDYVAPSKR